MRHIPAKLCAKSRPGMRPPRRVLERLQRRHRDVSLWLASDPNGEVRWALVQVRPQEPVTMIRVLRGPNGEYVDPTIENTVQYLDRIHWSTWVGWQGQRRLEQMDEQQDQAMMQPMRDHEPMRREAASRIYDASHGRIVVARP